MCSIIDDFLTDKYEIIRSTAGTYSGGFYIPGPKETFMVWGSLQPSTARKLKLQEEGNRITEYFVFYSDIPIRVNNPKNLADSDKVIINNESFKVMSALHWEGVSVDLPYHKTVLVREPQ